MEPILFIGALVYSSLISLLSIGITLTYMTTKVPNFAHASLATLGAYVSLTVAKLWNVNPYAALPLAFFVSGIAALLMYRFALRPQIEKGASITMLMITTVAAYILLGAVLNIYADYLQFSQHVISRSFLLSGLDFVVAGLPGLSLVSPGLTIGLALLLYVFLTKTDFGIGLRATTENPDLAMVLGIDVYRVNHFSWFLAGGLAGVSGSLLPIWFYASPNLGDFLLIPVFAASTLGGLASIYGAVLGAYLVGMSEILGTAYLGIYLGSWIIPFRPLIPLAIMIVVLLFVPYGLVSIRWRRR